ncbi:hypothetical protein D3C86_2141340 [compost metagenome]
MVVPRQAHLSPEQVRLDLGRWLALGLEFLLGADILRRPKNALVHFNWGLALLH